MRNTFKSLLSAALIASISGIAAHATEVKPTNQNSGTYSAPKMEHKASEVKTEIKDEVKKDGTKVDTKDVKIEGKTVPSTATPSVTPSTDAKPKI